MNISVDGIYIDDECTYCQSKTTCKFHKALKLDDVILLIEFIREFIYEYIQKENSYPNFLKLFDEYEMTATNRNKSKLFFDMVCLIDLMDKWTTFGTDTITDFETEVKNIQADIFNTTFEKKIIIISI